MITNIKRDPIFKILFLFSIKIIKMSQLNADCLEEIFELLEDDKATLYSCLLVNRLWCKVSVRILWKDIWNGQSTQTLKSTQSLQKAIRTLFDCLPKEHHLHKNGTVITSNTLFNYASFCKVFSINKINQYFDTLVRHSTNKRKSYIQEILGKFMSQITSLNKLSYHLDQSKTPNNISITGTMDCLTDLLVLECDTDIHSEFFYQLSQVCHNIKSLHIRFRCSIPDGLKDLISSQNGLKYLSLIQVDSDDTTDSLIGIVPSLAKHSNTITKLYLEKYFEPLSLSFITKFANLKELKLVFNSEDLIETFDDSFQYASFPQLQILKLYHSYPKGVVFIGFLKNNGRNLKEFYLNNYHSVRIYNLTIAKFCSNLRSLHIRLLNIEKEKTLKVIFNSCQQLESIGINSMNLNTKELLKIITKYSPENFHELELGYHSIEPKLFLEGLESFLISWKERTPQKSFSFIINFRKLKEKDEKKLIKIVEKYKKMGIIKIFNYTT
jgi:hypothetical protein